MAEMIDDLEAAFARLLPRRDALLDGMEEEAAREGLPIAGPLVGSLLAALVRYGGARRVLELGTCTGYTAVFIARALGEDGHLDTLERDPDLARRAREGFARAGVADRVTVHGGEAEATLAVLEGPYDLAFLDIDKEGYLPALPHLARLLRPGGLLVVDNTAFRSSLDFDEALAGSPEWLAVPILAHLPGHRPERDGVTVALRR